jgi:hypothetical protein
MYDIKKQEKKQNRKGKRVDQGCISKMQTKPKPAKKISLTKKKNQMGAHRVIGGAQRNRG